MLSKEQRDWAAKFLGFDIAPQNDAADGQDTHAGTGGLEPGAVASSEDTGGSGRQADQAKRGDPKRSPAGGGKLTYHDVMVLTDNLAYLAQPQFRRATGKAGPPKLNLSATPAIAAPLEKAADAVRLWADPKTVPQAAKSWWPAEPALRAILREAAAEPLK